MSKPHGARIDRYDKEAKKIKERKEKGLCIKCGVRDAAKDRVICRRCLNIMKRYRQNKKEQEINKVE